LFAEQNQNQGAVEKRGPALTSAEMTFEKKKKSNSIENLATLVCG